MGVPAAKTRGIVAGSKSRPPNAVRLRSRPMPPLPAEHLVLGLPGRVVFSLLVLAAIAAFVYSASRRVRVLLAGRPDDRFTRIPERIRRTLEYAFAQKRMFRDFYAGVFHILIFAGFVVLTVRTMELVVAGLVPGFTLLAGSAGNLYTLVKDVFEVLVLVGVFMAVFRRLFARPARLDLSMDAWFILFLIAYLMVTDLVAEAARTALAPSLATPWAPAVAAVAGALAGVVSRAPAVALPVLLVDPPARHPVLRKLPAVLEALPHHHVDPEHLLHEPRADGEAPHDRPREHGTFRRRARRGPDVEADARRLHVHRMRPVPRGVPDRADRQAARPEDLHRQRPRRRVRGRRRESWRRPTVAANRSRARGATSSAAGSRRTRSGPARCAGSARRRARCSSSPRSTRSRRCAATSSSTRPSSRRRSRTRSAEWRPTGTRGTSARPRAATGRTAFPWRRWRRCEGKDIEVLFWVGCAGSYEDRAKRVSKALVEILNEAGVSFAILGGEETCTGDSARRLGNEYLFQMLAQQNVETLNGYKVRKIVTNCPHCFNCLGNEYGDFGGKYEVVHGSQLVAELVAAGSREADDSDSGDDHLPRPVLPRALQRRLRGAARASCARSRASS